MRCCALIFASFLSIFFCLRIMPIYTSSDPSDWEKVISFYSTALQALASSKKNGSNPLLKLDKWFWNELPAILQNRKDGLYLEKNELIKVMEWKLERGKFRPTLKAQVASNTPESVKHITKIAYAQLPDTKAAMKTMTELKGVGPATATALLTAASPLIPFMSDEAMASIPLLGKITYTTGFFSQYLAKIQEKYDELKKNNGEHLTPRLIEKALWVDAICKKFGISMAGDTNKFAESSKEKSNQDELSKYSKKLKSKIESLDVKNVGKRKSSVNEKTAEDVERAEKRKKTKV